MLRMRKDLLGLRIARLLLFDYLQDSISSFTLLDYTARQCCRRHVKTVFAAPRYVKTGTSTAHRSILCLLGSAIPVN